jgi:hypothetical protein
VAQVAVVPEEAAVAAETDPEVKVNQIQVVVAEVPVEFLVHTVALAEAV